MNFAYFRDSTRSFEDTVQETKSAIEKADFKLLGQTPLPNDMGTMLLVCKSDWLAALLKENRQLAGFMPCAITVMKQDGKVMVGSGQPSIIKALSQTKQSAEIATQAEEALRLIIHEAAGVEALKPSGVKLYSTTTCPYCKMEKSWLESKSVKHNVVYVDMNQAEAERMVEKTGQMGVPVTEIQYTDADSEFIVGFDKNKLAASLGV